MSVTQLPDLILFNIFSHLSTSPTHLCTVTQVCKQWQQQAKNPVLWRIPLFKLPRGKLGESVYGKGSEKGGGGVDYKKMYMTKCMGTRWHNGVCPVVLNGHNCMYILTTLSFTYFISSPFFFISLLLCFLLVSSIFLPSFPLFPPSLFLYLSFFPSFPLFSFLLLINKKILALLFLLSFTPLSYNYFTSTGCMRWF